MKDVLLKCSLAAVVMVAAVVQSSAQTPSIKQQRATALQLEENGQIVEAEAAWHAVLSVHPSDAEAYAHLGLLEARQEHYGAAVLLYSKSFALDPAGPDVRLD